eukprot:3355235-Ditylum_brightwellii.AAC.1
MIKFRDMYNRNLKLAALIITKDTEDKKYRAETSTLHTPVTESSTLLSSADTPKQSNVSSFTDNIDFEVNNNNKKIEETTQTSIVATTSTAYTHEEIQHSSVNILPDDMQYIGVEEWARATVAAEKLYLSHPPEKKNR